MFEAQLLDGTPLKKILETLQGIVDEANLDCSETAVSMQAMDNAHVALVSLFLNSAGFDDFRCDRGISLGFKVESMVKIFKCMDSKDSVTIRADDRPDSIHFVFEAPNTERLSEFELKLMDIDSEHLAVPEQEYAVEVSMPANEFQRICRDLSALGDTISVDASKDSIKFKVEGGIGAGTVALKQHVAVDEKKGEIPTTIKCSDPVELQFAMNYFNNFAKASAVSKSVTIRLASAAPIMFEYSLGELGHLQFFLAPKIEE
ncbi:Proliferating cell nuclear antigen [Plasmodiophora brassicae]